jgi:signal transduction histidine kinase
MNESIHGEKTTSEPQDRVTELIEQQTAISEVLRAIASSPHDLQPIFDAILDSATRLCRADIGSLRLSEESGFRRVAVRGDPLLVSRAWSLFPVLAKKGSLLSRLATRRLPIHIPDLAAVEGGLRDDYWITLVNAGFGSGLLVPLLKGNEIVGIITLARKQVQPFTDKQISLFRDFAAQAAIALEGTRRERQYREMQSELAHANRVATMGQLTASIAHEIKQPIATARNNARAALNFLGWHPLDLSELKEALDCVVADADRAGAIVDRIGSFIKKSPPRKEIVDLNAAILEVTALTHSEALKTGVTVGTQLAGELPRIPCDRVQLQQVILNLIVNAIQSMSGVEDRNRELHISTVSIEPEGVRVAVRDTGHGLRPESLPRLFEPFYTTKPDGMGMGLSICRSIIEAHGGRLWATACEPRGALFQFTIPTD